mmetsp:Transcript_16872/g.37387  ORF Transcript_16872/g.37387 Transcript_16872/m.37387 type:complete len:212 (+) Transcript_16872:1224-1859(+)
MDVAQEITQRNIVHILVTINIIKCVSQISTTTTPDTMSSTAASSAVLIGQPTTQRISGHIQTGPHPHGVHCRHPIHDVGTERRYQTGHDSKAMSGSVAPIVIATILKRPPQSLDPIAGTNGKRCDGRVERIALLVGHYSAATSSTRITAAAAAASTASERPVQIDVLNLLPHKDVGHVIYGVPETVGIVKPRIVPNYHGRVGTSSGITAVG